MIKQFVIVLISLGTLFAGAQPTPGSESVAHADFERVVRLLLGHGGEITLGADLRSLGAFSEFLPEGTEVVLTVERRLGGGSSDVFVALPNPQRDDSTMLAFIERFTGSGWRLFRFERGDWTWYRSIGSGFVPFRSFNQGDGKEEWREASSIESLPLSDGLFCREEGGLQSLAFTRLFDTTDDVFAAAPSPDYRTFLHLQIGGRALNFGCEALLR